ncbi:B12-binding domain-containing radical SAM protein [Patescibacteria group bacterium]|nr:B12-binding domain-containing radical SAM protein [Patescibacteria group bacterium]
MNICLIAPQTPFLENVSFPPLNLLYLSSYLKLHGYDDIELVDLNVTDDVPSADVYMITATTPQFPYATELLRKLKGITIIGGAHATADTNSCNLFDIVIQGEGEKAILQCLKDIEAGGYEPVYAGTQIANLDELPIPARENIEPAHYSYYIDDALSTIAMTSRGCPYICRFCQKMYPNVRFHSTSYVLKELLSIRNCGYGGVYFVDDMFGLRYNLLELAPQLKKLVWKCQIRPDENINNIKIMGDMKCRGVNIGIESGSQKILDTVNKKANIKRVPEVVKECKAQGMEVRAYIIVGLPSETHETVEETIEFLRMIEPDSVGVGTFVPYPGTYIHSHIKDFDIKIEEPDYRKWYFRAERKKYNCVVSTSELTADEILRYRDKIDEEFN